MNDIIRTIKSHRSIRKFTDQKIEDWQLKEIALSAQCASTSSFMQNYSIIAIENQETKLKLAELGGEQKYIETCPVFLVFCADLDRFTRISEKHTDEIKRGFTEMFITSTVDAGLAAQNALLAAESMGLGGVYIGGIRNHPDEICELLEIPENVYPVFGMCLGYPDQDPEIKPRLPMDVVLKREKFNRENEAELLEAYDETMQAYYLRRTKGKRDDKWTDQVADKMKSELRPHMREHLNKQGFYMK